MNPSTLTQLHQAASQFCQTDEDDFMRCAIYARYSTDNQNEESIESQVATCKEFIEREGWTLAPDHIYSDYAISGSTVNRPALQNLMVAARRRPKPFDKVVVYSKSRLSRSSLHDLQITADLEGQGVRSSAQLSPFTSLLVVGEWLWMVPSEWLMRFIWPRSRKT